ncbi:MAG: dTDP-4-dehydrorhamnose reductase [Ilumatobacter sp.]|jgi:dTDP-4-dehydrorhamnose reductase
MLVTGGSGFLGRHLTTGNASNRWELIAPSSSSMDITRRDSTIEAITDWRPTAVVHLAYRKGDRQSIVNGSRHVAEAAAVCGARLVHMSTDVIFPGRAAPYTEADRPFPTIDYGRDKRDAEDAVMLACPTAVMIRTSLLYGTSQLGHVQLDVQRALSTGSDRHPMTFFTDEYRCPVHAADVSNAIAELATRPGIIGPLNVAGPEALSRSEFARATATWMGHDPNRLLTSTIAEAGAVRPARIVLDTGKAIALGITCRSVSESYGLN